MFYTTYKNGDDWGMVYYLCYCFTHIILKVTRVLDGWNGGVAKIGTQLFKV